MSSQKLSSLNFFHFENLQCLLIIVRSGPVLMLAWVKTFANNNVTLHFQTELGKAKLDGEVTKYCKSSDLAIMQAKLCHNPIH
jgi:hypothetical protein